MAQISATLPPGHYIIGDPVYLKKYEHDVLFWTNGDGGFYDNFDNCYYVDSARLAVFSVNRKPSSLPKGTHYFVFKNAWTVDFDTHHLTEQIKITVPTDCEVTHKYLQVNPI